MTTACGGLRAASFPATVVDIRVFLICTDCAFGRLTSKSLQFMCGILPVSSKIYAAMYIMKLDIELMIEPIEQFR